MTGLRQKRQRAARGARDDGSIDRPHSRRAAPDHVSLLGVGSGDAPEVVAVVGKLFRQFDAEAAMDFGGDNEF